MKFEKWRQALEAGHMPSAVCVPEYGKWKEQPNSNCCNPML
jgi:hypothetical protein